MAVWYVHRCGNCGYIIETSGQHEFYRDKDGKRKSYGHPTPASKEAEECGICGWYAKEYCVSCDEVIEVVTEEYEEPEPKTRFWSDWSEGPEFPEQMLEVFSERLDLAEQRKKAEEGGGKVITCPKCSGFDLVLGPREELICPVCKKVGMKGEMKCMS